MRHKHNFLGLLFIVPIFSLSFAKAQEPHKNSNSSVDVDNFSDLVDAIASGITEITFKKDIVATSAIDIDGSAGDTVHIDGNNHVFSAEVTGANEQGILNDNSSQYSLITNEGSLSLSNMTIRGGAYSAIVNSGNLLMDNCAVERSGSLDAAGGGLDNEGNAYVKNSKFSRNNADHGGGFLNSSGLLVMDSCSLNENRSLASNGGGGGGENGANLIMNNCTIANNTSTEIGGALNCNGGGITAVVNSTITGNITTYFLNAGGGIGENGSQIIVSNSIASNNYSYYDYEAVEIYGVDNKIVSDFNKYYYDYESPLNYDLIHSAYSHCYKLLMNEETQKASIEEIGDNEFKTFKETKKIPDDSSPFSTYVDSPILNDDGTPMDELFHRPIITKCANGAYVAPIKNNSIFCSGGTNIYLNLPEDMSSWSLENIGFGYGDDNNIECFKYIDENGEEASFLKPTAADRVSVFQDGSPRAMNAPIMGACEPNDAEYYTLTVLPGSNGSITGGSIYGDSYPKGTPISLFTVPDDGYALKCWEDADNPFTTYPSDKFVNFSLDKSYKIRPVFTNEGVNTINNLKPKTEENINNGYIKIDPSAVTSNTVAIEIHPKEGCTLNSLRVYKSDDQTPVEVINNKFVMPNFSVTIDATFIAAYNITNNAPISKADVNHGYIVVDSSSVANKEITIQIYPNEGYQLDVLRVHKTGDESGSIAVNNYKFIMPECAVTIDATFKTGAVPPVPPVPPTPNSPNCFYHWISLTLTIVNVASFVLFTFFIKFKNVKLITCAASSVLALIFAIVGASLYTCAFCITLAVISGVLLIVETAITCIRKNNDDDNYNNKSADKNNTTTVDDKKRDAVTTNKKPSKKRKTE